MKNRICQHNTWSGERDLNPRPSRWQRDALPLSYLRIKWYIGTGSNCRPIGCKPIALPAELPMHILCCPPRHLSVGFQRFACAEACIGSRGRARTCDNLVNSQALYQLSYTGTSDDWSAHEGHAFIAFSCGSTISKIRRLAMTVSDHVSNVIRRFASVNT